jgi:hypothetical protein
MTYATPENGSVVSVAEADMTAKAPFTLPINPLIPQQAAPVCRIFSGLSLSF